MMLFRFALVLVLVLGSAATTARAFSLTGFPSQSEIDAGLVNRWADYADAPGQPFTLTYAIDYDFLANQDPETAANAVAAIEAALQSWSDATNGMLRFEPAEWGAVRNQGSPPSQFVGPPQADVDACQDLCEAQCCANPDNCTILEQIQCVAPCFQQNCQSAGWGAHIDFFSAPTGYSVTIGQTNFLMEGCNLGFTATYINGSKLRSADIYLNSDWNWTTNAEDANPARATPNAPPAEPALVPSMCGCGRHVSEAHHHGAADRAACMNQQNTLTIDLQTVLVHEIGHALGLDHPDDAPSGRNFDPYVFTSVSPNPFAIMDSDYVGVKRELIADDIGGLAYLYPPELYGDVNADAQIGFVDAFAALDIFEGRVPKDPWTVNRLDFNSRNGKIDMDELQQLLLWIIDPSNHPPGEVPSQNPALWETGDLRASTITIDGGTDPYDIGVGGVVSLGLTIDNPDQRIVQGWDIRVQYNSDILENPRYGIPRDFLTGSSLIPMMDTPLDPGLSEIRIGSLGFDSDDSAQGLLATVEFDINLPAAAAVSHVDFLFNVETSEIVVADPYSHAFSQDPNFTDETLNYVTITADAYLLDLDQNNVVDVNDLYTYTASPADVNYDGVTGCNGSVCDRDILASILRMNEIDDVAGAHQGQGGLPTSATRGRNTGEATGRQSLND